MMVPCTSLLAALAFVLSSVADAASTRVGQMQERASLTAGKDSPLERVVKLLEEMKGTLTKEAKADAEAYDKMTCWCETNEKEKTKAVSDADAFITEAELTVQSLSAKNGELSTKIAHLKKEIAKKKEALDTATKMREQEHSDFLAEEKDTIQSLTMLKNALQILGRHHSGLLQVTPAIQESIGSALRFVALKHEEMIAMRSEGSKLKPASKSAAGALLQAADSALSSVDGTVARALRGKRSPAPEIPPEYAARLLAKVVQEQASFAQQPAAHKEGAYSAQSGQIFGILGTMKDEFEANLASSQKTEAEASAAFEELAAAAKNDISSSSVMLDDYEGEYSSDKKELSDTKEDLTATREQRSADVKFLSDLNLECKDLDRDYAKRSKARNDEIVAVSDAIAILTEDDARELFHKKNTLFLQVSSFSSRRDARKHAAGVLLQAAQSLSQPEVLNADYDALAAAWRSNEEKPREQLAAIAVQVQLDAFTKVKEMMDKMVADLKTQQAEEVAKKTNCNSELNTNEKQQYTTNENLDDLNDKIASLEQKIEKLDEEIAAAQDEIKSTEVEVKQASEQRKKENEEFQQEVNDQRAVQSILKKAMDRLALVYKKKSFLQQEPNSPVKFQPYKQNAGSSPVLTMLEDIIEDSVNVEKETMAAETEAQQTYESYVKDANDSINALNGSIATKSETKVAATAEKEQASAEAKSTSTELEDLKDYEADLHTDCDFVLKNFDIRQKARLQEIEAIQSAKAYLNGMED